MHSIDGDKGIGSIGSQWHFVRSYWSVVKMDIMYFSKFHDKGMFGKSLNATFMDLISKKVGALEVKDFRPISLVSCILKFW